MRHWIKLFENADEFSTKGHADIRVRPNDPRFSDNPLVSEPAMLDEFDAPDLTFDRHSEQGMSELDRLHDAFTRGGITDQEIAQGTIELTPEKLQAVAAAFGTSPDRIKLMINSLVEQLRQEGQDDIAESYRCFMEDTAEAPEDGSDTAPLNQDGERADYFSAEDDALGNVTVRSAETGQHREFHGSTATTINNRLSAAGHDQRAKQDVLRPLMELSDEDQPTSYRDEIMSGRGTYNFPWKVQGRSGLGTMAYGIKDGKPDLTLISVRDQEGNDVQLKSAMRRAVMAQAKAYIPNV